MLLKGSDGLASDGVGVLAVVDVQGVYSGVVGQLVQALRGARDDRLVVRKGVIKCVGKS